MAVQRTFIGLECRLGFRQSSQPEQALDAVQMD